MTDTLPIDRLQDLARRIARCAPSEGTVELRARGTYATRVSHAMKTASHAVQRSALCIVAQGAKTLMAGDLLVPYEAGQLVVYSVDLPVTAQVTRATPAEPYLNFRLDLDPERIALLASRVYPRGIPPSTQGRGLYASPADASIVDAATRLLDVATHPRDAELLAPLVADELLIRLLCSPVGERVAQIGRHESTLRRIAAAITWLRTNYDQPVSIDDLSSRASLSPSAFHRQFRAVTALSPLQYQKALRLQEARRLLVSGQSDVGEAGRRVGYLSPSQFSREYGRFFGRTPTKDLQHLGEAPSSARREDRQRG